MSGAGAGDELVPAHVAEFGRVMQALLDGPDAELVRQVIARGGSLRAVLLAVEPRVTARRAAWHEGELTATGHEPEPRGLVVEGTGVIAPIEVGHASYEEYQRMLYDGRKADAQLGRPDDKPEQPPMGPRSPRIRGPRRTQVVDGSGDPAPEPWRIRPWREGEQP